MLATRLTQGSDQFRVADFALAADPACECCQNHGSFQRGKWLRTVNNRSSWASVKLIGSGYSSGSSLRGPPEDPSSDHFNLGTCVEFAAHGNNSSPQKHMRELGD